MNGSLPYQDIISLMEAGLLRGFSADSVQPSSIDLSIGEEMYRLQSTLLPRHGERIRDLLDKIVRFPHDFSQPLEPDGLYLCRIAESVTLPGELYGYTNPKSSTGRNDIHVRLLADGVPRFDTIPRGFSGDLWALISSRHFLLKLSPDDRLLQLRLFNTDTRLDKDEIRDAYREYSFLWTPQGTEIPYEDRKISDHDGSLLMSIDLQTEDIVGYRAKPAKMAPVLVFNAQGHHVEDFFDPMERPRDESLRLEAAHFYVVYTYEWTRVPPLFAAEMAAVDERSGDFRSHYAGFIDPGWGYGREGQEHGWPIVLEIRPFDDNLIIRHKQPICKLRYERVRAIPSRVYGETGSNYIRQRGAMLSKHFRVPANA